MTRKKESKYKDYFDDNKWRVLLGALSIILILGMVFVSIEYEKESKNSKIAEDTKDYVKWKEEGYGGENLNVYEKIKKGDGINILVLGDGKGLSQGKTNDEGEWTRKLYSWLEEEYKCHANIINLSSINGTVYKGFNEVMQKDLTNYDLIILLYGENDNKNLSVDEFGTLYEGIIRKLRLDNDCDIIPVIENSIKEKNDYSSFVKELSKYYNLSYADVERAFMSWKEPYNDLVNDSHEPNDKGYEIYFNVIKNVIEKNIEYPKNVPKDKIKPLCNNDIDLNSYNYVTEYSENNGFLTIEDKMISSKQGATIEFTVKGNWIGVSFICNSIGGKADVYINDKLCTTIDTFSKTKETKNILISTKEARSNHVKIVQTSRDGKRVVILGCMGFNT